MNTLTPRTIEGQTATAASSPFGQPAYGQSATGRPGLEGPPSFRPQIMRSLRMHPKLALTAGVLVAVGLIYLGLIQPRVYEAQSLVYVEPVVPGSYSPQGVPGFDQFRYGSYVDQQMQTVVRPDVLAQALSTLPDGVWNLPNESRQAAIARLQKALIVERQVTSYQISIKLKTSDAQKSADVVNAVTNAYLSHAKSDELTLTDGREKLLREERQRIQDELDTDHKEQTSLGTILGVANPVNELGNPFDTQLTTLRAQLATARQAHDVAAAQLSSVSGSDAEHKSGLAAAANESILTEPGVSAMKSSVSARRAVLESQMAGLTPSNPQYKQDQDEIADLDRSLDAMIAEVRHGEERRIQDKLRTELQSTAAVESQLNAQLAQQTAQATGAGPKLQRATELATDIARLNLRFASVDENLHALELQTNGPGMAHLLAAAVPTDPEGNRRNLFLLAALPCGLLFGVLAAVLARAMDRRIYLGADLEQVIGFAPIAVLPAREDVATRVFDEYVLRLAAGVEGAYRTASARTFVMTPVSAETTTGTLLRALARKLEELRLKVLVLQAADLLVTSKETAEYQAASMAAPAVVHERGVSFRNLHAGEGIATAKLDRLKGENDLILIDAAPLLHSAETEYAARCSDATILVAESGVTQRAELMEVTALLARLQVTGVGAVLEQLKLQHADESFKHAIRVVQLRNLDGAAERKFQARREASDPVGTAVRAATPVVPISVVKTEPSSGKTPAAEVVEPPLVIPHIPILVPTHPDEAPKPGVAAAAPDWQIPVAQTLISRTPDWEIPVPRELTARDPIPDAWKREIPDIAPLMEEKRSVLVRPAGYKGKQVEVPASTLASKPAETPTPIAASHEAELDIPVRPVVAAQEAAPARMEGPRLPRKTVDTLVPAVEERSVGRFAGEPGPSAAVPPHTSSKIRLAFKEHEVNAKTTWFSKLFRGDPPSSFKIIPDEEALEMAMDQGGRPLERLPETTETADPELRHLLNRINSGVRKVPEPVPVKAAEAEVQAKVTDAATPLPLPAWVSEVPANGNGRLPDRPVAVPQILSEVAEVTTATPVVARSAASPSTLHTLAGLASTDAGLWPAKAPRPVELESTPVDAPKAAPVQASAEIPAAQQAAPIVATATPVSSLKPAIALAPRRVSAPLLEHIIPSTPPRFPRPETSVSPRSASNLDPILPLQSEPTPWHQRSSEHGLVASAEEQIAEQRDPVAFTPRGALFVPPTVAMPKSPAGAGSSAAAGVAREAASVVAEEIPATPSLSRRWRLLSQFDGGNRESADTAAQADARQPMADRFRPSDEG